MCARKGVDGKLCVCVCVCSVCALCVCFRRLFSSFCLGQCLFCTLPGLCWCWWWFAFLWADAPLIFTTLYRVKFLGVSVCFFWQSCWTHGSPFLQCCQINCLSFFPRRGFPALSNMGCGLMGGLMEITPAKDNGEQERMSSAHHELCISFCPKREFGGNKTSSGREGSHGSCTPT